MTRTSEHRRLKLNQILNACLHGTGVSTMNRFSTIHSGGHRIFPIIIFREGRTAVTAAPLLFAVVLLSVLTGTANAQSASQQLPTLPEQINIQKPRSNDDKPNLGTMDDEMRAKQGLKLLEKEYKDNIQRAKEAADLSAQLRDAVKSGRTVGHEETKKLERLEKLAKKIRDDAGGSEEETVIDDPPGKLDSALARLADVADSLYKALEKTPRQVISASVIENANVLLKLARLTKNLF